MTNLRSLILRSLLVPSLLAPTILACGGNGGGGDGPDAKPPSTMKLTLHAAGASLLAIQPEGAAWQTLTPGANGDALVEIPTGRYTLAYGCDQTDFFDFSTVLGGPTDSLEQNAYCVENTGAPVTVSIESPITLEVSIGYMRTRTNSPLPITAGTYDVVAIDRSTTPPRFEIRRNVAITADTTLTFDLATTGTPMRSAIVTNDATADEGTSTTVALYTSLNTHASTVTNDGTAWMFPKSALVAGDRERLSVWASKDAGSRSANQSLTGDETAITVALPAGITTAAGTWNAAPSATWTVPGTWGERYIYAANADFTVLYDVDVLPGWIAAGTDDHKIEGLAATAAPGWKSSWTVPAPADLAWTLLLYTDGHNDAGQAVEWDGTYVTARHAVDAATPSTPSAPDASGLRAEKLARIAALTR